MQFGQNHRVAARFSIFFYFLPFFTFFTFPVNRPASAPQGLPEKAYLSLRAGDVLGCSVVRLGDRWAAKNSWATY
jgi:preprotein translocase subunit YajC